MEKSYISTRTSTADLCGLLIAVYAILLRRAYLCTLTAVRTAASWLKTPHNFAPDDDDEPVIMTGYQYVIFTIVCCLVFIALSIKYQD